MNIKNLFKKRKPYIIPIVDMTVTAGSMCPKCKRDGIFLVNFVGQHPYYLCEDCCKTSTVNEFKNFNNMMLRKEKLEKINKLNAK